VFIDALERLFRLQQILEEAHLGVIGVVVYVGQVMGFDFLLG
jgi:hypothetical protein